jgi:hypothetical protein
MKGNRLAQRTLIFDRATINEFDAGRVLLLRFQRQQCLHRCFKLLLTSELIHLRYECVLELLGPQFCHFFHILQQMEVLITLIQGSHEQSSNMLGLTWSPA